MTATKTTAREMVTAVLARKAEMIANNADGYGWVEAAAHARYMTAIRNIRVWVNADGDIVATTAGGSFGYVASDTLDIDPEVYGWGHILEDAPNRYRLVTDCQCGMNHEPVE